MSFILDALKKSESDRQRQSGPSLFEVKVAPPRRSLPIWAVAIAVLLAINVIVISWMLLRHPSAQQRTAASPKAASPTTTLRRDTVQDAPAARAAVTPPLQSPATAGQTAGSAPAPAGVTPAAPAGITPPPAARTGSPEQPSAPPPAAGAGSAHDATPSAPENPGDYAPAVEPGAPGGSAAPGAATADLPLYQQIVTSDGLPALHLDLHVFADRPQDRFAMINMHRVREGDSLPGGTHVEAIRPDGVVLTYRGTRFLLPRN